MDKLRRNRGTASLEAFLSLGLLLLVLFFAWNIARNIYEASIINNAAQLAAQTAMQVYDRGAPRDCNIRDCSVQIDNAVSKGRSIFSSNFCTGGRFPPLGSSSSISCPLPQGSVGVTIECAARPSGITPIDRWRNCPGTEPQNNAVVRATVTANFAVELFLLPGVSLPSATVSPAYSYAWRVGDE